MNVENFLDTPWAYTGSIAMKLHANRLGVPFSSRRIIRNTNIAVANPIATARILRSTGQWNYANGQSRNHVAMISSGNNRLNLFRLGGNYARGNITYARGKPVLTLNSLMNRKRNLSKNKLRPNNMTKTLRNIQFLQVLLNASRTRSPSRTPSPKKRKLSPNRNLEKTPSPAASKKFKKLAF